MLIFVWPSGTFLDGVFPCVELIKLLYKRYVMAIFQHTTTTAGIPMLTKFTHLHPVGNLWLVFLKLPVCVFKTSSLFNSRYITCGLFPVIYCHSTQISSCGLILFIYLFIYLHPHSVNKLLANICIPYRYPTTQNLRDLEFDLSKPLKVKCDSAVGHPIYGFLLTFNSNLGPN